MIAGQVAVGFVPLVGQIADVRDLVLSLKRIIVDGRYDEAEEWIALGFIMIAFIPGVGDVIKAARRPIIQFIRTLVAAAPELTKRLTKEILPELRELLSGKIDDLMEWAEKKYGKNLDETLEKNPKKSKFEGKEEAAKSVTNVSKSVHIGKQGKHILEHNNFQAGKSILSSKPQTLLDGFHAGKFKTLRTFDNKVIVDFGSDIGTFYKGGNAIGPTRFGTIHYGKSGAHIVPANPVQF